MAGPNDTAGADALPGRAGGKRWASWPVAMVLVWAALAVTDVIVILPSGATSRPPVATHHSAVQSHPANSPSPAPSHHVLRPRTLIPVAVSAFGPAGSASGDNPQTAAMAIDASTATAWQTDWYLSAEFGNLKPWTGLLIDMGHPVRITGTRILLGSARGADLRVRAERVPGPATDRSQASASDAGGLVRLTLSRPKRARYLLIWLTVLPPDSAGTFQASVYNVVIKGTASATR
jgi:hypothetical protein